MSQNYEPTIGLFDRIILAIKREEELTKTRKLVFTFFALLVVSVSAAPFSWQYLINQLNESGTFYFVSAAMSNLGSAVFFWEDFGIAIAESFPVSGVSIFILNLILAVFTIRLFIHKRGLVWKTI